jgi:WD40 repeat protein
VNFISFSNGGIKIKKGTGLKGDNLQTIMCGAYINNTLVTGTFKGELLVWNGTAYTKSIKAHQGTVNAIYLRDNNTGFITGGNDGSILIFDQNYKITNKLSINTAEIKSLCPKVRAICENSNGNILVGTRASEIIEFIDEKPVIHLRGHFDNELWGLSIHPSSEKYYTAGQDKMLALWDIRKRSIEKVFNYII